MHGVFLMGGVAKQLFFERHSGSRPRMWKPVIWRYRSDLADCRAPSSPTASVCSGCLPLWLLSVNPEISTFISCSSSPLSLLFSSHLLSNLSSPVSLLPHFHWHVFVLSFHPPPWHLTMEVVAVSGFLFPFSFFFFFLLALPLFFLSLETKKNTTFIFFVYKTCHPFCAKYKMWICLWGCIDLWRNWDMIGYSYVFDTCYCLRYPYEQTIPHLCCKANRYLGVKKKKAFRSFNSILYASLMFWKCVTYAYLARLLLLFQLRKLYYHIWQTPMTVLCTLSLMDVSGTALLVCLVCQSIHPPDWKISTTVGWISIKCCVFMAPRGWFLLTLPPAPPWGWHMCLEWNVWTTIGWIAMKLGAFRRCWSWSIYLQNGSFKSSAVLFF